MYELFKLFTVRRSRESISVFHVDKTVYNCQRCNSEIIPESKMKIIRFLQRPKSRDSKNIRDDIEIGRSVEISQAIKRQKFGKLLKIFSRSPRWKILPRWIRRLFSPEMYNYGCSMINPRIYLEHEAFSSGSVYIPDKPVNLETS